MKLGPYFVRYDIVPPMPAGKMSSRTLHAMDMKVARVKAFICLDESGAVYRSVGGPYIDPARVQDLDA